MAKDILTDRMLSDEQSQAQLERKKKREKELAELKAKKEKREQVSAAFKRYFYIALGFFFVFVILFGRLFIQVRDLKRELEDAQKSLSESQSQIDELEETLSIVSSDEYIEMQARQRLRMIKEGEVVYVFGDE